MHQDRGGRRSAAQGMTRLGAGLMGAALVATAAGAQTRTFSFDLPPEPLDKALRDYGEVADQQLIFAPDLVRGRTSPGVRGQLGAPEALNLLLQGSGLAWRRAPAGGIMIVEEPTPRPQPGGAPAAEPPRALEEVVVTGTHIAGQAPVGAHPVVVDRMQIEALGRGNASDLLKALPEEVSLGAGEEARGATQSSQPTLNFANSPNLRGLGTDATLSLLDGVRLPPTTYGGLVDISQIPLVALERVEVLADGASAIYGSDAVGGVVNFILKRDQDGGEARVRAGVADGLDDEIASVDEGRTWSSGSVFGALEYEHRSALAASARPSIFTDDLRAVGGPDLRQTTASPGNISANGTTFAIPPGQDGRTLTPGELVAGTLNKNNRWAGADILPSISRLSGAMDFRQEITPWAELFGEALGQSRESVKRDIPAVSSLVVPRSNPFFVSPNPTATSVNVLYSFIGDFGPTAPRARVEDLLLTGGLKLRLPADWRATLQGTFAHDRTQFYFDSLPNTALLAQALADPDPATAFDPFGAAGSNSAAVLNSVRGFSSMRSHIGYSAVDVEASGPVLELPGGAVALAVGAEARHEHLVSANASFGSRLVPVLSGFNLARDVQAAYAEADVPIVGPDNEVPGIQGLKASAAVRGERYSDSGGSTNPKFGVEWTPISDLKVSGTWGTSFKAPTLFQKDTSTNLTLTTRVALSSAPGGFVNVIQLAGKAPGLTPETARTWTVGADWTPRQLPGLQLGVHYFSVDYKNRILMGTSAEIAAAVASSAPSPLIITRSPTEAEVAAIYASPQFVTSTPMLPASQIFAIVDFRQQNLGTVQQSGYDLSGTYGWDTPLGHWQAAVAAVYIDRYEVGRIPGKPLVSLRNTIANPLDWRGNATLSWSRDAWAASLRANYVAGYSNTTIAPAQPVASWTTFDLHLAYAPDDGPLGRQRIRVSLDAQNLFDRAPPPVANVAGSLAYDPEEASALGRLVSVTLDKRW